MKIQNHLKADQKKWTAPKLPTWLWEQRILILTVCSWIFQYSFFYLLFFKFLKFLVLVRYYWRRGGLFNFDMSLHDKNSQRKVRVCKYFLYPLYLLSTCGFKWFNLSCFISICWHSLVVILFFIFHTWLINHLHAVSNSQTFCELELVNRSSTNQW